MRKLEQGSKLSRAFTTGPKITNMALNFIVPFLRTWTCSRYKRGATKRSKWAIGCFRVP